MIEKLEVSASAPLDEDQKTRVPLPRGGMPATGTADPEVLALLDQLDAASDEHAARKRPANTTRAYAADWRAWEAFASASGFPAWAVRRGTLRAFVTQCWADGDAPTTIDRRLAGIAVTLRTTYRRDVNPGDTADARELLKDLIREAAENREPVRGRGEAAPLLLPDLRRVCAACGDRVAGIRDRAVVLMAFAVAGRRSELAGLNDGDVVDEGDNGLLVDIRVSKTKRRTVAVPYGSNPATCPVRAWRAWQQAKRNAGVVDGGPAFLRIDRHGRVLGALSGQAVGSILTRAGERAGLDVRLTGHSGRAGLATEARRAGKDRKAISNTTGHVDGSAALERYFRTTDQWTESDNALIGIGL